MIDFLFRSISNAAFLIDAPVHGNRVRLFGSRGTRRSEMEFRHSAHLCCFGLFCDHSSCPFWLNSIRNGCPVFMNASSISWLPFSWARTEDQIGVGSPTRMHKLPFRSNEMAVWGIIIPRLFFLSAIWITSVNNLDKPVSTYSSNCFLTSCSSWVWAASFVVSLRVLFFVWARSSWLIHHYPQVEFVWAMVYCDCSANASL